VTYQFRPTRAGGLAWTGMDGLLLAMVLVWGANFSLVKVLLRHLTPLAFNSVRLLISSALFLLAIATTRTLERGRKARGRNSGRANPASRQGLSVFGASSRLTGRDWAIMVILGVFGHFLYQLFFVEGLARTSVANASLIIGCTPLVIALASAALGTDRIQRMHWIGAALSFYGIYLVVGRGARLSNVSFLGDLMMIGSVACWTVYTLVGRELLTRHSALIVTAYSMVIGTALYVPYSARDLASTDWASVVPSVWVGIFASGLLALNIAYIIWYMAVQRLGSARTAVYSNLVPVAALAIAALWLGDPIPLTTAVGAGLVIAGLLLTRVRS
jgi:drug/metabolite transporter (DMT)-like permease